MNIRNPGRHLPTLLQKPCKALYGNLSVTASILQYSTSADEQNHRLLQHILHWGEQDKHITSAFLQEPFRGYYSFSSCLQMLPFKNRTAILPWGLDKCTLLAPKGNTAIAFQTLQARPCTCWRAAGGRPRAALQPCCWDQRGGPPRRP
jgi:hypothetical protein